MQLLAISLQKSALSATGSFGGYPLPSQRKQSIIINITHITHITNTILCQGQFGGLPTTQPAQAKHHYEDRRL